MFYLLSSAHPASRNGLPIDGYSCLEYGGHMFWCARVFFTKLCARMSSSVWFPHHSSDQRLCQGHSFC